MFFSCNKSFYLHNIKCMCVYMFMFYHAVVKSKSTEGKSSREAALSLVNDKELASKGIISQRQRLFN